VYTGFVQRGLPRSSPKNAAAPLYQNKRDTSLFRRAKVVKVWIEVVELANSRGEARLLALVRFGCTSPPPSLPVFKIVLTRQSPIVVVPRLAGTIVLVRLGVGDSAAATAAFTAAAMRRRR